MAHIHDRGFIHRDVKPQNVLLNGTGDALICDLGTVKKMDEYESYAEEEEEEEYDMEASVAMTKDLGTPLYMSPEQMRREAYNNAVDVWAYGIMMVRLFGLGEPYHSGITIKELKTQVSMNEIKPNTLDANDLPHPGIKEIVEGCVEFCPEERYTFEQIEVKLANILKEMEATSQQEKELRSVLKRHNIGRCYDKLVAEGLTSKEDLINVTAEDLIGMGMKKFEARKVVGAFSSQP
jgi:serine/threonine protein kinase